MYLRIGCILHSSALFVISMEALDCVVTEINITGGFVDAIAKTIGGIGHLSSGGGLFTTNEYQTHCSNQADDD